ncbi:MAG: fused MFS/spermidine synthase [Gemmatimonadota bacterium]|nr:fused MFS/spermidine synthase [Gemmatimonadota bacterium]
MTTALSGALLFAIEMGIGKQILPLMGGAPATWNACILFFQAMVLLGSLYVIAIERITFARQLAAHSVLCVAAILALPIWLASRVSPAISPGAVSAVVALTATCGLVVLALCTTSPLLQNWIHRRGGDDNPYALYVASNGGCLAGLLAYPFLIEPRFGLRAQSSAWSMMFLIVVALVMTVGLVQLRRPRGIAADVGESAGRAPAPVTRNDRLGWVFLALIPASLLAGTNTSLTTDIAPAPLIWVFPLAAYLLSFVIAFWPSDRKKPDGARGQLAAIVIWLLFIFLQPPVPAWLKLALPVAVLFFSALVCNTRLYAARPHPSRLAEFYVCIALGGLLGTALNVLIAPALFVFRVEYPIAIIAACMYRPSEPLDSPSRGRSNRELLIIAALFAGLMIASKVPELPQIVGPAVGSLFIALAIAAAAYRFRSTPAGLVLVICSVLAAAAAAPSADGRVIVRNRDFYGELQVRESADGKFISLWHGTTIHGAQERKPRPAPLLYYALYGPLGQIFRSRDLDRVPKTVGVIGLGTGASSAYALPGQRWTYYELNPSVIEQAVSGHTFTFLRDWSPDARIVTGDARLLLREAPDASYDLIIVDAFNSDAVPVHLLTLEAFRLYFRKLAPGGLIALHISNRYLTLDRVVNAAAGSLRVRARLQWWRPTNEQKSIGFIVPSQWVALARTDGDLGSLVADPRWLPLEAKPMRPWTDDFSDLATVFRWRVLTND